MSTHRRLIRALWLAAVAAVMLGELSPGSSPLMKTIATADVNDKILHFSAYLVLALLPGLVEVSRLRLVCTAGAIVALGVTLEFLQKLVPGRSFELLDMLANTLGVCTGLLLSSLRYRLTARS